MMMTQTPISDPFPANPYQVSFFFIIFFLIGFTYCDLNRQIVIMFSQTADNGTLLTDSQWLLAVVKTSYICTQEGRLKYTATAKKVASPFRVI
jgi:hypothetical protein